MTNTRTDPEVSIQNPKTIGVLGLGNMGSGIARNLAKSQFITTGYDPITHKVDDLVADGLHARSSAAEVGKDADAVFVMVMAASDAHEALFGEDGLCTTLQPGATVIITATFHPHEVVEIAEQLHRRGYHVIDTPVSGGYPGAQGGTLTLMTSAPDDLLAANRPVLEAISASIHHVGSEPGMGQTVKACLQSLLGSIFSATMEAVVMAAKAGVPGQTALDVFSTSSGGSPLMQGCIEKMIDREFEGGGSHIATMHKDLTISTSFAQKLGVPLFTASMAMQLFQSGITRYPDGDNWVITKILEDIAQVEVSR
ncbi:MAG: NAD(P)-dependent oxidoreductase [Pseudomonadota bacterium]